MDVRGRRLDQYPLERLGTPRKAAETVLCLASERSNFITGDSIVVDGGPTRGLPNPLIHLQHERVPDARRFRTL